MSASPRPSFNDPQRRATLGSINMNQTQTMPHNVATTLRQSPATNNFVQKSPMNAQNTQTRPTSRFEGSLGAPAHLGSMPYLPALQQQPHMIQQPNPILIGPNMPAQGNVLQANAAQWNRSNNAPNWPPNAVVCSSVYISVYILVTSFSFLMNPFQYLA